MGLTDSIIGFRRSLKRKNFSRCTVRDYLSTLRQFVLWLDVPIETVDRKKILSFIDHLLDRRLSPKTINCYLDSIRSFYRYLKDEEGVEIENPVKSGYLLRLPKPLPRFLKDEEVEKLFGAIDHVRDRAIFTLMLRCGLRVEETAALRVEDLDLRRGMILVRSGKGAKGRMVYMISDAHGALMDYLRVRPTVRSRSLFLVDKGALKGKPLSVRGIQKRMELYAKRAEIKTSCHELRHTMATQLLNAGADLTVIQDLLGHSRGGHNAEVLPGLKPQGAKGLLQGDGTGRAEDFAGRLEARDRVVLPAALGPPPTSHGWTHSRRPFRGSAHGRDKNPMQAPWTLQHGRLK